MAGSGTTLLEARLLGRSSVGYDIDPLACLITRVKAEYVDDSVVDKTARLVVNQVTNDLATLCLEEISPELKRRATPPDFPRRDYWFDLPVSRTLALLSFHIANTPMSVAVRNFLWVALSSVILSKVSVANARDIIHSRHHHFTHAAPPDVMARFQTRVKTMRKQVASFQELCKEAPASVVDIRQSDARQLPNQDGSVDLVVTSPPYATALDYSRAHFLAVPWMQPVFGLSLEQYMALAPNYIGSERGHVGRAFKLDEQIALFPSAQSVLSSLQERDLRQAQLIQRYLVDMHLVLSEMHRVLRTGGHVFIIVCPSHVRKVQIPTHDLFTEMGQALGLSQVAKYQRTINGNRRVLPYMREAFGDRMHTEYVLVYRKD